MMGIRESHMCLVMAMGHEGDFEADKKLTIAMAMAMVVISAVVMVMVKMMVIVKMMAIVKVMAMVMAMVMAAKVSLTVHFHQCCR